MFKQIILKQIHHTGSLLSSSPTNCRLRRLLPTSISTLFQYSLLAIPTLFVVACGYSGPLYLPQKGTPSQNMSKNQYAPATNAESAAPKSWLPAYIVESKESTTLKTVTHNTESMPNAD